MVRELAELPRARHDLPKALRTHELHRPRAVQANVIEQRHGVVGAHVMLAPYGATLALAVRKQAEEVRANHVLPVGPVRDGHGERERDAAVGLVVAKAHQTAPVLVKRPCGNAGDKNAEIDDGHGYVPSPTRVIPCSRAISR